MLFRSGMVECDPVRPMAVPGFSFPGALFRDWVTWAGADALTGVPMAWVLLAAIIALFWAVLYGPDIPFPVLRRRYAATDSRYLELPNGITLHYRDVGSADRPVVILLHGYGDSFTSWNGWVDTLGADCRVIALDLPGHGLTEAPSDFQLSSHAYLDVVRSFVMALGIDRFSLAGNSMGGGVSWLYASTYPEAVRALVLVDAAGWPLPPPEKLPIAFRILQYRLGRWLLARIDNKPLIVDGLRGIVRDPSLITPAFVARWSALQRAPGHREILMSAAPTSLVLASSQLLQAITAPTLVMHGEADSLIPPEHGRLFVEHIRGAKWLPYPNVGHLPQLEIPEQSARDALGFLVEIEGGE